MGIQNLTWYKKFDSLN
uniref:Uncharacterized protein n=1 Tax=Arundo donax TaxID=35708 RepID=A0A0A8XX59_ARUDO